MYLYDRKQFDKFKFKFPGLEKIDKSYSQSLQDMFVLAVLKGKRDGTFLEIGSDGPHFINNTFLLESKFGWRGISIDINAGAMNQFKDSGRTAHFILGNALDVDYEEALSSNGFDSQIDYLSLDLEPNSQTLECLKRLPLDKYRFSVITYETDAYDTNAPEGFEGSQKRRDESREILQSYGYVLINGNISNLDNDHPFEDWYVDPNVIDESIISLMKREDDSALAAHLYMFNQG